MTAQCAALFTPRDEHNYRVFSAWLVAAMFTFAAATILIDGRMITIALGWTLTAATAVLLVVTTQRYILFLRQADELLRKVHLEALALAFGAGFVVMMVYRLCERLGAPKLDVNDVGLVMSVVWIAWQWLGGRRYSSATEEQ